MDRLVIAHIEGASDLLFRSMSGYESLSNAYMYLVDLISLNGELDLKSLLSQSLSLQIKQTTGADHWLNGRVVAAALRGIEEHSSRYYVYQLEVRPNFWFLTQNIDFRIFQDKTVPEILQILLRRHNILFESRLAENYREWEYCVQYNESTFDFLSRLMEHEGVYYYFEHTKNNHTLVLADSPDAHLLLTVPLIPYRGSKVSSLPDEACVDNWQVCDRVTPQYFSMDDYDFRKPYASLLDVKENRASYSESRTEVYEWPGHFIDLEHAQFYNKIRQQEKEAVQQQMSGSATTCAFSPGYKVGITKLPRALDGQEYLIASVQYTLWHNSYLCSDEYRDGCSGDGCSNEHSDAPGRGQRVEFVVIPSETYWRSPRITQWPKTQGPQTARVVCPPNETIWTDKYGRVKVKFHWDRYANGDETSSCWVRVSSVWAGMGFGAIQIPRINDEVVVDFINGDPDRPIIIGRVFNAANMPP